MTSEELRQLEARGIVRISDAVRKEAALHIAERAWEIAGERLGVRRDAPETWKRVPPAIMKKAKEEESLFAPLLGTRVAESLDQLLGEGEWAHPPYSGQILMSPPDRDHWMLPHSVWHMDSPAPAGFVGMPGVQLFLLLDEIEPEAGNTLVVSGSHRLVEDLAERQDPGFSGKSAEVRRALARVPWLGDLWKPGRDAERRERLMDRSSDWNGTALQVVELTGQAGDLYFMHPWMLHAPAPHAGKRMRMMLVERLIALRLANRMGFPI